MQISPLFNRLLSELDVYTGNLKALFPILGTAQDQTSSLVSVLYIRLISRNAESHRTLAIIFI